MSSPMALRIEVPYVGRTISLYPLQRRFLKLGFLLALIFGLIFRSPVAAVSILVLFGCMGALWQPGVPILAYCMGYQWLYVVSGFLFYKVRGFYPGFQSVDHIESAVLVSLIGFIVIVAEVA